MRIEPKDYIKTVFAIGTGYMERTEAPDITAANVMVAFMVGPSLIAEGAINSPGRDITNQDNFNYLLGTVDKLPEDLKFDDILDAIRAMEPSEVSRICDAGREVMREMIEDRKMMPVNATEKKKLVDHFRGSTPAPN